MFVDLLIDLLAQTGSLDSWAFAYLWPVDRILTWTFTYRGVHSCTAANYFVEEFAV